MAVPGGGGGSEMETVVPWPGSLFDGEFAAMLFGEAAAIGSPRPVPSWARRCVCFTCPNAFSATTSSSWLMPTPVSVTDTMAPPSFVRLASTMMRPRSGVNL